MKNKNKTLLLAMGILILLAIATSAHYQGFSAVDEMEIRYGGSTMYTTAQSHSIDTWNALGKVNIAPDTIYTYEDLTYSDYYDPGSGFDGRYIPNSYGSDDLKFNQYKMNRFTSDGKKKTALHELGHALGLAHSYAPNVMYEISEQYTQLGQHDKDDYNYLYP
ncbi:MAG: matrixin family metalloprotease [Candidatus Methanoperedens sp.]